MTSSRKPRRMARESGEPGADQKRGALVHTADQYASGNPGVSKKSMVVAMLGKDGGASLAAIVAATGWLPHTARAALTGLRKQGQSIERFSLDGKTQYRIPAAVDAQ